MAALRYAVRKLLLQRTQASVVTPAVERRFLPRLIHSGPSASGASNSCTTKTLKIQEELQKKKQELYNVLAEVERGRYYMLTGRVAIERFRNLKLLQSLSVEVEPKPSDPKWRSYRNTHIFHGLLICTASIIIAHDVGCMLGGGVKQENIQMQR